MPFQTKITRARWVLGPFTSEDMAEIGQKLADDMGYRIKSGINVNDQQAKPLKPGYVKQKQKHGMLAIRDWMYTGRTMRSLKVKSASENRCVIGFVDPNADKLAHFNNRREKQFGVSPNDRLGLRAMVIFVLRKARIIQFRRAA